MSLYKRGATWHYVFFVRGKRYRGSTGEKKLTRAKKVESLRMAEVLEGRDTLFRRAPRLLDFEPRFTAWVDASQLRTKSKRYYKDGWKLLKRTNLIYLRLSDITRDQVQEANWGDLSGAYTNNGIRTLRRMLGKAEEWRVIGNAPRLALRPENGREATIDAESEAAILAHSEDDDFKDAFLVMQDSGLRREEAARMQIENINWQTRTYFNERGKGKRSRRHVLLSDRVFDRLFIRAGAKKEGWMFPSKRAKTGHIHPDTLSHLFLEAREAAGLPESIVLYSARHTYGSDLMERSGDPKLVMETMGHADFRTTTRYLHPDHERARMLINQRNVDNRHKNSHNRPQPEVTN